MKLGPGACVVPKADPPLKVAHAARGDKRPATTCNTRRLRVESVISSRWYPGRKAARMYAVDVVWTVMCGPCGPVVIVVTGDG